MSETYQPEQEQGNPRKSETEIKRKPTEIITAMGSVYKYLPDGRTQRFKTATGELSEPQDTIVFIPPFETIKDWALKAYPKIFKGIENEAQYEALLVHYVHGGNKTIRVTDQTGKELTNNTEAAKAERVLAALVDKDDTTQSFYLPVSREPKIGYNTYDTTKYKDENGETVRDKHLGNKVTDIKYQES
jgi:hypothetical protein